MGFFLEGRYNVGFEDAGSVYPPAIRHRILLNFEVRRRRTSRPIRCWSRILDEVKEKGPEMVVAGRV